MNQDEQDIETVDDDSLRGIPPHSIEAEIAVLGSILKSDTFINECIKRNLKPDDFYIEHHKIIYKAMVESLPEIPDILRVSMQLRNAKKLDEIGGQTALDHLVDQVPTSCHGEYYLDIVIGKAKLRELVLECRGIIDTVHDNHHPSEEILSQAKFKIHQISMHKTTFESTQDLVTRVAGIYKNARNVGRIGLSSRWYDFHTRILSYLPGKNTIIAARPGQGKTTFGLNECLNMALHGHPALIASIEMSKDEIIERAIGDLMGLDMARFKKGLASEKEMADFERGGKIISNIPLYVEHGNFPIEHICALVRDYKASKKIECCMIDYVQLIAQSEGRKFSNRNAELSWISQQIVHTGNETGVHFLTLSQLSRGMMSGPDKGEPELHHLRDSGSLEQDAYMTVFIFQDPGMSGEYPDNQPTVFKVAKHRGGPSPTRTMMVFQKTKQRLVGRDYKTLDAGKFEKATKEKVRIHEHSHVKEEAPF